jgi:leader peptidase (prepilin peptidase)/N-methyltransferase
MKVFAASLGLILGGVLNWLADSLPTVRTLQIPRCEHCTAPRTAWAWLAWSGLLSGNWRCDYCQQPRRLRALVLEAFTTIAAAALFARNHDPGYFFADLVVGFLFLLILVIDLEHRLVLHMVSIPAAILVTLLGILISRQEPQTILIGGGVGFVAGMVLYLFGLLFARIISARRGQNLEQVALGFGDVTLSTVIGLSVGYPGVLVALFLGVLAAGEFSLVYLFNMFIGRKYEAFTAIPYGPFLILGAGIVYYGRGELVRELFPWGPLIFLGVLIVGFAVAGAFRPEQESPKFMQDA